MSWIRIFFGSKTPSFCRSPILPLLWLKRSENVWIDDNALSLFSERALEAVWKKAHLYWLWRFPARAECSAFVLSIRTSSETDRTIVGGQWLSGARIHF